MRIVLQRVKCASVEVSAAVVGEIGVGFVLLVGVGSGDSEEDMDWLISKVISLRIFPDGKGKMDKSLRDIDGDVLVVSQFTLFASLKKGTKPSFSKAEKPVLAEVIYQQFVHKLEIQLGKLVSKGVFGAEMNVKLNNWGPVTIVLDSKIKE